MKISFFGDIARTDRVDRDFADRLVLTGDAADKIHVRLPQLLAGCPMAMLGALYLFVAEGRFRATISAVKRFATFDRVCMR